MNVGCENGECTSVSIIVLAIGQQNGDDDVFVFSIDKVYLGGCDFSVEEVKNDRLVLPKLQFADRHFFSHSEPITGHSDLCRKFDVRLSISP